MRLLLILAILVIVVQGVGYAVILHNQRFTCLQTQAINVRIQDAQRAALKTIGTPKAAGYKYYQAHPHELAQVKAQLRQTIIDFKPAKCTGLFSH